MANKIQIHPQVEEIKKIWLENRKKLSTYAIWEGLIKERFNFKQSDMYIFYRTVQQWEREELRKEIEEMSYYQVKKIQKQNRRMIDILLNRTLEKNLESPKSTKSSEFNKILKLYNLIERIEKSKKEKKRKFY